MAPTYDVFLSHNGRDKPAVEHLAERLRRAGLTPWLDKWELTPGGRWQDELHTGLLACRAFAYFLGPNGEGDWAREELDSARSRAAKDREFRIFPVLLPGTPDPFDRTTMPPFLGHRTWVDLRRGLDDPTGLQAFINAIKGVPLGAPDAAMPVSGAGDAPPYRGLDAFDEADAPFFFGREPDVQQLLEQLKETRFLAVLGPSGSGKSSLVRAGLVSAVRRGALAGSDGWPVEILKPGARPSEAIAARLLALGGPAGPGAGVGVGPAVVAGMQATLDGLLTDPRTLHLATTLTLGDAPDRRLVWVIDQAEELFTLCHDERERAAVIDNLTYAASVPGGRAIVVLAMRADFYARAAAHPDLAAHISRAQHLVAPLTPDGIRDAIEEPARAVGLSFEEGLVGTILDDLEGQPGSLPLLQYALLELWKRRRGGMLTLEGYREAGGVEGAIAKRAEAIYAAFTPDEQGIARRALLRLTQPGEGTEDTRRRASMRELVTTADELAEVQSVVGELTDARLLTASADPTTGEGLVDISHEALIRAWPRVRQWLDEDRAGQRVLRRITEATAEWLRLGRDEGLLYRGARLAEAAEWREEQADLLNDDERAFLDASAALAARERLSRERARRRVTIASAVLAAVFLVLAGLAGIQWLSAESERRDADTQRQEAEAARAEADRRATEADEQRRIADEQRATAEQQRAAAEQARADADAARLDAQGKALAFLAQGSQAYRDRALLLALEAGHRSESPDVRALLLDELTAEPQVVRFFGALGPAVTWLDLQDGPGRIAWMDALGTVRVSTVGTPDQLLLSATMPSGIGGAVALSQDGALVAGSGGTSVALWDVATGAQRWAVTLEGTVRVVRLSFVAGEEPVLAAATWDGSVRLLDLATGAQLRPTVPPETPILGSTGLVPFAIAFDATGASYARVEQDGAIGTWSTMDGSAIIEPIKRPPPVGLTVDVPHSVLDLSWAPGGSQVSILFNDGFGILLGGAEPQIAGPFATGVADGLRILEVAPDEGLLVASANRGLRSLPFSKLTQLAWSSVSARPQPSAVDSGESASLVVAGYPDGRLAILDLGERSPLAVRLLPLATGASATAADLATAIRRDGGAFAWYEWTTQNIRVLDPSGGALADVATDATWVEAIALLDDGSRMLTVEDRTTATGADGWLVTRSLPEGTVVAERDLGPWGFRIAATPDGAQVLVGDARGGLSLQGTADGTIRWRAPDDPARTAITAVELGADGRTVRAGVQHASGLTSLAALATWSLDDPAAPATEVTIDADRISALATTPDGARVLIAASDAQSAADGRLLVLEAGDARPSGTLGPPRDNLAALVVAPDGRLLSGGPSGWYAWSVDPTDWERRACAIAARELSADEWRDALGDEPQAPTCAADGSIGR